MTVAKFVTLHCDHIACRGGDAWNPGLLHSSAVTLRQEARKWGWVRQGGKDLCPDHAPPSSVDEGNPDR